MAGRFPSSSEAPMHEPHEDRWPPLVAGLVFVAGLVLLAYALTTSARSGEAAQAVQQPALTVVAGPKPAVDQPATAAAPARPRRATWAEWTSLYRPLYTSGDRAFGVS